MRGTLHDGRPGVGGAVRTTEPFAKKIRLVAIQVHAQFVVDDGETLAPLESYGLQSPPVAVTPADWPEFAAGPFVRAVADLEQQINATPALPPG